MPGRTDTGGCLCMNSVYISGSREDWVLRCVRVTCGCGCGCRVVVGPPRSRSESVATVHTCTAPRREHSTARPPGDRGPTSCPLPSPRPEWSTSATVSSSLACATQIVNRVGLEEHIQNCCVLFKRNVN